MKLKKIINYHKILRELLSKDGTTRGQLRQLTGWPYNTIVSILKGWTQEGYLNLTTRHLHLIKTDQHVYKIKEEKRQDILKDIGMRPNVLKGSREGSRPKMNVKNALNKIKEGGLKLLTAKLDDYIDEATMEVINDDYIELVYNALGNLKKEF